MAVKLLISGMSNSGKTTLTNTLTDCLVVSHDGKNYPFAKPHTNVASFGSTAELITLINEKMEAYNTKFKTYPTTVVFDSVSKIFDTLLDSCNIKHTGFKVYSELNREIHEFTDYVQNVLISADINVVLVSHALYDAETAIYTLVGKGDFQRRGGFLAETDNAVFLETKNNKRIVHHRSTKFPARTTLSEISDYQNVEDYDLQGHIDLLAQVHSEVDSYEL